MISKELIRKTPCLRWTPLAGNLEEMPEKFTIDQFIDHLSLVQKIERGIQQSEQDRIITHKT